MSDQVLVCPHCLQLNMLSKNDLSKEACCLDCNKELLLNTPLDVNEKIFTQFITHSTLPVVVDFWGSWSGGGHEMAEIFTSLAKTFSGDAIFLRINSEQEQVLANSYKLVDIPTFILFTFGLEYHRIHGMLSEREFHLWLERYLRIKRKKEEHHPSSV